MLAKAYEGLGENGKAIETYLKVLRRFPESEEAHYNVAVLYNRTGESERAVKHLKRALELFPDGPLVSNIRAMLDSIG